MTVRTFVLALIAFSVSSIGLAASHIVEIAWTGEGRFVHGASVAPGKFLEICGKLAPGDAVQWRFESSAPLDFNIHYHVGKDVEFPAKSAQVARASGTLQVAIREDYCWMWTNKSTTAARVDVQLLR
jgi:hypothetical protein